MRENLRVIIAVFLSAFMLSLNYALAQKAAFSNEGIVSDKIEYKAEGLRDPFQEEGGQIDILIQQTTSQEIIEVKPLPPLEIQGIVWGGRFPQAIINNKVVKAGDIIDQVQIIDITKEGVTVSFDKRKYNLSSPASLNLQGAKKKP